MARSHTPTPWEAHQCGIYQKELRKPGDPFENCIAATGDDPDPEDERGSGERQEADAQFIVLAANAHYDLVAALQRARAELNPNSLGAVSAREMINAALKLAGAA